MCVCVCGKSVCISPRGIKRMYEEHTLCGKTRAAAATWPPPSLMSRTSRQSSSRASAAFLHPSEFHGDADGPGLVVLGAHYVPPEADPADSDSSRLRQSLLSTSVGRFCGVTYGDMNACPGFAKHNFKPAVPCSDAELVCLDYFWMQRGGGWIAKRYGSNWGAKIEATFAHSPKLKVFLVPKAYELFDESCADGLDNLAVRHGSGAVPSRAGPLAITRINVEEAELLHPLVVATQARDRSGSCHIPYWHAEGRIHALQISRYAPDGFLAFHRFPNDRTLRQYLADVCRPPPLPISKPAAVNKRPASTLPEPNRSRAKRQAVLKAEPARGGAPMPTRRKK